ncbi:hypothetical protein F4X86_02490 [Candidatus Saccharibacteria bacterium]|nr:hypothetical protein [Candidatus Saccharibacteria bacterium]
MENLRTEPELPTAVEGYISNSQHNFKAGQFRINQLWHEVKSMGEAHGFESSQYLEGVLLVLREELAYFSFAAGVYHCGASGYSSHEETVNRLSDKIQESAQKIECVGDRLKSTPDDNQPPVVEAVAAVSNRPESRAARLEDTRRKLLVKLADAEAQLEEVEWEHGSVFFNEGCVGVIDGYHEGRIKGLKQARSAKSRLEKKRSNLTGKINRLNAVLGVT